MIINISAPILSDDMETLDSETRLSVDYDRVFMENLDDTIVMSEEVKKTGRISLGVLGSFFFGYGGFLGILPCMLLLILGYSLSMYGIILVNEFLVEFQKMNFIKKMEAL